MQNEVTVVQQQPTAIISSEKFLMVYAPANCMKYSYKVATLGEAINLPAPSISQIKREQGEPFCEKFIMLWLVYLNEMLNLNKPMTEAQIRLCSSQLLAEYGYLKVTELTLIFKRILSGEYGEFYERLGIDKLLKFFREYDKERFEFIDEQRQREHAEFRYQEQKNETPLEDFKRNLKKAYRII